MPGLIEGLAKTTLILGAGASAPYGFPLGSRLRQQLEDAHTERDQLMEAIGHTDGELYRRTLQHYQAETIDEFLGTYKQHAQRAKAEIAYHLIKCENLHTLMRPGHADHWYKYLFMDVLGSDRDMGSGNLSIVSFNYDLSIRVYLYRTLQARFQLSDDEARTQLRKMPFVHVHGHVGALTEIQNKGRAFGSIDEAALKQAAKRMITIHEEPTAKHWEQAHALLRESRNILFLGFGFAEENIKRLDLETHCKGATAFMWPLACAGASKRLFTHAPSLKIFCRDEKPKEAPTNTPTLDRVRWLFQMARKPPKPVAPKPKRSSGFSGGGTSWMNR